MEIIKNENIDSENPLCFSLSNVYAYITNESGNQYLIFALTKKNKKSIRAIQITLEWN